MEERPNTINLTKKETMALYLFLGMIHTEALPSLSKDDWEKLNSVRDQVFTQLNN